MADQRDDDGFLDQLVLEVVHGTFDQVAAVIDRDDLHAFRQAFLQLVEFGPHSFNGCQGIFAIAHDHDAAGHFAFAVEFGHDPGATPGPRWMLASCLR